MTELRLQFLRHVMELYKHQSPMIASNSGYHSLKLCNNNRNTNRICQYCGQILIFGNTKIIRFKTKTKNRRFSISTLSHLINKTKHKKKLNYTIETCLYCNYKKYSQSSFTSLRYLKKQRLNKIKANQNKRNVLNVKNKNLESDKMKIDSKNVALKTVQNFEQMYQKKQNQKRKIKNDDDEKKKKKNEINEKNEMDRLLDLTSITSSNIKTLTSNKPMIGNNLNIKFNLRKAIKRK